MLQSHSDFFFTGPQIFFGSFHETMNDEDLEEDFEEWPLALQPFILEIDPKHPLQQKAGLYLLWPDM